MDDSGSKSEREVVWSKGELCLAPYSNDNKLYKAKVTAIKRNGRLALATVHYIGYDSDEDNDIPVYKLHKIRAKRINVKSPKSVVEEQRSTQDCGFFSPLRGNEEDRRLREKFASLEAEEEEEAKTSTSSKKRLNWTTLDSPCTSAVSQSHTHRKKSKLILTEDTSNKTSGRRKGVVASGGKAVQKKRKSSRLTESPENITPLDLNLVLEEESDSSIEYHPHMKDVTDRAMEMKGFSEEDFEKPHFSHPPLGAKEDYSLSDSTEIGDVKIPATINQYLRQYQREGIQFLYSHYEDNRGAILGDDMGLGKTVQVIAFLSAILGKTGTKVDMRRQRPSFIRQLSSESSLSSGDEVPQAFLIIAPGTVLYNWLDELETWGYFVVGKYHGSEKAKTMVDLRKGKLELVITTFETFRDNIETINNFPWTAVFVDEVHKIKGLKAQVTSALRKVNTQRRFGLTGTALQNNLQEFWSILDWANPGCLGDLQSFERSYILKIEQSQRHDATKRELAEGRKCKQRMAAIKNKYMLRRTKNLLVEQLPAKEDLVVYCKLTDMQTDIYKAILSQPDVVYILTQGDPCECDSGRTRGHCCYEKVGEQNIRSLTLTYMHLLLKVANHVALLVPDGSTSNRQVSYTENICNIVFENYPQFLQQDKWARFDTLSNPVYCGKMKVLVGILSVCAKNKSKVLLFSYSTRLLTVVEHFVVGKGYDYRRIDGMVSNKQRFEFTQQFNKDPNIFLCLISTKAGGLGLNLTGANVVVIYDPNWNPTYDLQAQDRAYRIGQRRDVKVYRLISQGTIEENIYLRQIYKQQLDSVTISEENARRYFTAVQGDGTRKGELFGVGNMFQFKTGDGCLTADILQRNNKLEKSLAGFQCYKYLVGQENSGSEKGECETAENTGCETASSDFQGIVGDFSDLAPEVSGDSSHANEPDSNGLEFVCSQIVDSNCEESTFCGGEVSTEDVIPEYVENCGTFDNQPSTSATKTVKRTSRNKICSSRSSISKRNSNISHSSSDSEGESQYFSTIKKNSKGSTDKSTRRRPGSTDSSLKSISDVLDQCGVVHTHQNKSVVGTSKAEDYMSKCAIKEVFELQQNSQEPAINCEPLQSSQVGKETKANKSKRKKNQVGSRNNNKQQGGPRKERIDNLQVLIGQTPKIVKRRHFTKMSKFFHADSEVTFARNVLSSTKAKRLTMLKDFYTTEHPELDSSSLFQVPASEPPGDKTTLRKSSISQTKGKRCFKQAKRQKGHGKAVKSNIKRGCVYGENDTYKATADDRTGSEADSGNQTRKTFVKVFSELMGHDDKLKVEPSEMSSQTKKVTYSDSVKFAPNVYGGPSKLNSSLGPKPNPLSSMSVLEDFFGDEDNTKSKVKPPPKRKYASPRRQMGKLEAYGTSLNFF